MVKSAPTQTPLNISDPESVITHPAWLQWLQEWYDWYNKTGKWVDPMNPDFGKLEPPETTGLLAYANGTDWSPGAAGYYRWNGAAWVAVG